MTKRVVLIGFLATVLGGGIAMAQADDGAEKTVGWFTATELSLVVTEGNSSTDTFAFKNSLTRAWEQSRVPSRIVGPFRMAGHAGKAGDDDRERILTTLMEEEIDGAISIRLVPLKGIKEEDWIANWRERRGASITFRHAFSFAGRVHLILVSCQDCQF